MQKEERGNQETIVQRLKQGPGSTSKNLPNNIFEFFCRNQGLQGTGASPVAQGQRIHLQCRRDRRGWFDPWVGKTPWKRKQQPTTVFLPGESHGQRSLVGYSSWGCKESDTTERLSLSARPTQVEDGNFRLSTRSLEHHPVTSPPMNQTTLKPFTMWSTTNCEKFLKRQEYQTVSPVS